MKTAQQTDWKTEPMPAEKARLVLDRTFSADEMERIRRGVVPEEMEDKWFVYVTDHRLYFHRSWTGFCVYIVLFEEREDGAVMVEAEVNRDQSQYRETSDDTDISMVSFLIDALLLRRPATFPSDEPSDEVRALKIWSSVGRAGLGEHPEDDE